MSNASRSPSGGDVTTSDDEPVLEVTDVSVTFDMDRGVGRVLDDVSIEIERGEILGIVGESGSGKSMFAASLLDAVVEPGNLNGEIRYRTTDGRDVDVLGLSDRDLRRFRWEAVSMVFQGAMNSFNPTITVREHFHDTIDAHNADRSATMERARSLLTDLHLETDRVLSSYPHELSGGQKQRALIALSLILRPNVLVMDEPTAALDLLMQRSIIEILTDLQETYDFSLVFITHDLPLVKDLCDRLAVMYAFEFIETGPTRDVIGNARHPYTRALLNATPNLDTPLDEMKPIVGKSPDPVNVPPGCSYHPRCPLADDRCEEEDPKLVSVGDNHRAACFYWDDVPDQIPLSTASEEENDE
jgi:oligopeptide/dipeptide ABC transporter ATP-binding protein